MPYRKAIPLYGSPSGNPAMASKRVSGPSAQRILLTKVAQERCGAKGCNNLAVVTRNPDRHTKERMCMAHIPAHPPVRATVQPRNNVARLLNLPWEE